MNPDIGASSNMCGHAWSDIVLICKHTYHLISKTILLFISITEPSQCLAIS